ncbi:hypothetical protein Bbelb_075030 [Branchiostoma belcheri]|nr:hypothetical protein Bbelb_075030 [Branchiostoma belcheri]
MEQSEVRLNQESPYSPKFCLQHGGGLLPKDGLLEGNKLLMLALSALKTRLCSTGSSPWTERSLGSTTRRLIYKDWLVEGSVPGSVSPISRRAVLAVAYP